MPITATSTSVVLGGLSACYVASSIWRRSLRAKFGVVTSLYQYLRLRYQLRDASKLLIIADFDRTLTSAACGVSCHGVVESCTGLSAEYRSETKKLFDHYFPIETDPTIPRAEKIPIMEEWYGKAHKLLLKEPFTPALLRSTASDSAIALRPGCDALLVGCHERGTPVVVMSAGLGNVIEAVMSQRLSPTTASKVCPDLPIVSNWLRFDAKNHLCGFSEPLMHMFNKDGSFVVDQLGERWPCLNRGRSTILLLGDGLGDAHMADGLDADHNVIKIGFLNEHDEARIAARLPQYENAFDAVVLGDRSFEWVLKLLRLE